MSDGSVQETAEATADIATAINGSSGEVGGRKRRQRPRERAVEVVGGDFLPGVRVGRLLTVNDWLVEFGKVYRAVRRGQISTSNGAKLSYMATTGKAMAEAVQQLAELAKLREQVAALQAGQFTPAASGFLLPPEPTSAVDGPIEAVIETLVTAPAGDVIDATIETAETVNTSTIDIALPVTATEEVAP